MSGSFFRATASAAAVLLLAACAQMPDYSPNYVRVPVYSTTQPHRIVSYQLVPEACLRPDPTDIQLGPRLPPGCANNANLLAMVERKGDVVRGRELGPAPASPTARAAQRYIYGTPSASGGGTSSGTRSSSPGSSSGETVPASPASPAPASPSTSSASLSH
jgi:hypothetical protein